MFWPSMKKKKKELLIKLGLIDEALHKEHFEFVSNYCNDYFFVTQLIKVEDNF